MTVLSRLSIVTLACLALFANTGRADESDCHDVPGDVNIHCTYATGLPADVKSGRYIKVSMKGQTETDCENYTTTMTFDNDDAKNLLGSNTEEWSICNDSAGTDCTLVGKATYTVTTTDNKKYTATPAENGIDFSKVNVNNFTVCNPSPSLKMHQKAH
jgi:hypothetical protein